MRIRPSIIVAFIAGIILTGVVVWFLNDRTSPTVPATAGLPNAPEFVSVPDVPTWQTYRNDMFGFSIEHPAHWRMYESLDNGVPMITLYEPANTVAPGGDSRAEPPYTHFSNATHVSFYPSGIPTEGVIGMTRPTTIQFMTDIKTAIDYLALPSGSDGSTTGGVTIESGRVWATMVVFENPPLNWKPWGFLWASVFMSDSDMVCYRDGARVDENACDPLVGDSVLHTGSPDPAIRAVEERMLESLRFF